MEATTVVRWTRYGKDRLYVKDAAGNDLGWVDARTGAVTAATPELAALVSAAVSGHVPRSEPTPKPVVEPADPMPDVPAVSTHSAEHKGVPVRDWFDLAQNRPGQAARARADEELAAMKDRSRVGTWLARTLDVKTDERAWRVGADGEETIGAKLDKLTKHGWHVLHAVPVGNRGSDIDHVVIGPGGVFTVNTKKHPGKSVWVGGGTVMINGQRVPYIRNSEHEADRAESLLTAAVGFPVFVKPVLVFTTGTLVPDVTIKSKPERVVILDRMDVPRAFKRATAKLEPEQIDAIYAAARRSTTWGGSPRGQTNGSLRP